MKKSLLFLISLFSLSLGACDSSVSESSQSTSEQTTSSQSTSSQSTSVNEHIYQIYRLYLSNGGTKTYEEWLASIKGDNGLSAYEIYLKYHPGYTGDEAKWLDDLTNGKLGNKDKYTVDFYDGNTLICSESVEHGHLVNKPETTPSALGKIFDGWYTEEDEQWSFNRYAIYGNLKLFARYTSEPFTYELVNDEAYIVSYTGNDETIMIPLTSGGYNVVGIKDKAFKNCTASSISLTDNIRSIGYCAFENCTNIAEIKIPSSVVSMGNTAFVGCSSLRKVIYNTNVFPIDGTLFKGSSIKTVEFGGTAVPDKACYGCDNLTKIILNDSISSLGNYCFYGCTEVSSIVLSAAITNTGFYSFYSSGLKSIILHEGITNVDNSFRDCMLDYIVFPTSLVNVTSQSFYGCPDTMITFYNGNQTQWEQVSISLDSSVVKNNVYFFLESEPVGVGNYWHYVNGIPTIWE